MNKEKMNKTLTLYIYMGVGTAILVETVNMILGNTIGIGMVLYWLTIIAYLNIRQCWNQEKNDKSNR